MLRRVGSIVVTAIFIISMLALCSMDKKHFAMASNYVPATFQIGGK